MSFFPVPLTLSDSLYVVQDTGTDLPVQSQIKTQRTNQLHGFNIDITPKMPGLVYLFPHFDIYKKYVLPEVKVSQPTHYRGVKIKAIKG